MFNKKLYYLIFLSILLYVSIDISHYYNIALGKEDDSDNEDSTIENEKETDDNSDSTNNDVSEDTEEKDLEGAFLDKLFGINDDNDNSDSNDNEVREENKEHEEEKKGDEVPFILPFKAVPFP